MLGKGEESILFVQEKLVFINGYFPGVIFQATHWLSRFVSGERWKREMNDFYRTWLWCTNITYIFLPAISPL